MDTCAERTDVKVGLPDAQAGTVTVETNSGTGLVLIDQRHRERCDRNDLDIQRVELVEERRGDTLPRFEGAAALEGEVEHQRSVVSPGARDALTHFRDVTLERLGRALPVLESRRRRDDLDDGRKRVTRCDT